MTEKLKRELQKQIRIKQVKKRKEEHRGSFSNARELNKQLSTNADNMIFM